MLINNCKSLIKILTLIVISLTGFSCNTTKVATTWADPDFSGDGFQKIVVIGMFRNAASRREFENAIAKKISENSNTQAIPSLNILPPNVKYEHGKMEAQFNQMGIDGILIIRTKSIDSKTEYVPGQSYTVLTSKPAYYYDYPFYYKYYVNTYETIREPGYYKETFIVCTESTIFRNSDDRIVWMMEKSTTQQYETVDGITDPKKEAKRSAELIFKDLQANHMILAK